MVLTCRAVGVVKITQKSKRKKGGRESNDRLIAVPTCATHYDEVQDARALPPRVRREIEEFFVTAVLFQDKALRLEGWGGPKRAEELIDQAAKAFARAS